MKKSYITIVSALAAMAGVLLLPGSVLAGTNPNTDNPSGWGKFTSGAATTDGQDFGDHASTQDTPRFGIGNVLNQGAPQDGTDSKHPSELGQVLCQNDPGFPCP